MFKKLVDFQATMASIFRARLDECLFLHLNEYRYLKKKIDTTIETFYIKKIEAKTCLAALENQLSDKLNMNRPFSVIENEECIKNVSTHFQYSP